MKTRFLFLNLLFLFWSIQVGFSQNFNNQNKTVPLPENVRTIAARYNQTVFGKNAFVFSPEMDMKDVQTLIDSIHAGQVFPANEFSENRYALLFKPGIYHCKGRFEAIRWPFKRGVYGRL